ncbi:TIGR02221 family CRISPR-associated protein [Ectothiorhodospira shaposhnikovii]|uniref:TIGR02221 family CRISPR-associated protein n=1 Tax=Ectothiorhodospira shaposhnikovii TaxID=1054 RepID=UPI0039A05EE8
MARLFISFLGTGNYVPCHYFMDTDEPAPSRMENVRFIQTALLHLKCGHFKPGDRILLGCTAGARARNLSAFEEELAASGWSESIPVEVIDLPDITGEAELWEIFERLSVEVGEGDEISFDITHSFRFLPMLFTVLIQYLKVTRGVQLAGVHYGAFEKLGSPAVVQDMPMAERNAPILDLTPFLTLFDWSIGIDRLIRSGDPGEVIALVNRHTQPVLRDTRGKDATAKALEKASRALDELGQAISTVRGRELTRLMVKSRITDPLAQVREDFLPPLRPVIDKLTGELKDWEDASPLNVLRAVAWCHRHGQIQQGYTLLQEGIISLMVDANQPLLEQVRSDTRDEQAAQTKRRTLISRLMGVLSAKQPPPPEAWEHELAEYRDIALELRQQIPGELAGCYGRITELRNDINHGGFGQATTARKLKDELERLYQEVLVIIDGLANAPGKAK